MQKIISGLKDLDKNTYKIMKYGLLFSCTLCLTAIAILLSYIFSGLLISYYIGFALVKSSFIFAVEFIVCGIIVDFIKNKSIY